MQHMHKRSGFTLIELTVSLVIIGLIIGGILVGQSVIRTSELQGIISDVERYKKAIGMFKEKYKFLPGDLPTAVNFWGSKGNCMSATVSTTTGTATCNGTGEGYIGGPVGGSYVATITNVGDTYYPEALYAWQHLANAGFIQGAYSGAPFTGDVYKPGVNIPSSSGGSGTGFTLFYAEPINEDQETSLGILEANAYPANYRHILEYGFAEQTAVTEGLYQPALEPGEAYKIDLKTDDGIPSSGNVLSFSSASTCVTASSPPAAYRLTVQGRQCALIFITGF